MYIDIDPYIVQIIPIKTILYLLTTLLYCKLQECVFNDIYFLLLITFWLDFPFNWMLIL